MLLRRLQESLGRIYDLPLEHDVREFLVTDRASLGGAQLAIRLNSEEELLVRQETMCE
jgi:hypothetical protein